MLVFPEAESVQDREINWTDCFICQKDGDGKLVSPFRSCEKQIEARIFQQDRT